MQNDDDKEKWAMAKALFKIKYVYRWMAQSWKLETRKNYEEKLN